MKTNYLEVYTGENIFYRYFENKNSRENLLFIHGNYASSLIWTGIFPKLSENYNVYAPDMRGFGNSSYNNPARKMIDYAYDIEGFIRALRLNDLSIIAWSAGAAVAMEVARLLSFKIKKLFLVDPISTRGYASPYSQALALNKLTRDLLNIPDEIFKGLNPYQKVSNFVPSYEQLKTFCESLLFNFKLPESEFLKSIIDQMLLQRNNVDFWEAMNDFNLNPSQLKEIKAKPILIWGIYDKIIREDDLRDTYKDFEGRAKLIKFNKSAHAPFIDQKDDFIKLIIENN